MNAKNILELVRAGYTKSEIEAMVNENADDKKPDPVPESPAQVAETETPEAEEQEDRKPPVSPGTELDRLYAELRNLTAAMQANNRAAADMGAKIIEPQKAAINTMRELASVPEPKE